LAKARVDGFFRSASENFRALFWTIAALTAGGPELMAQLDTEIDFKRTVYMNEFSIGPMFHTRGYGVNFRRNYFLDGYTKHGWELDAVNIRHPKEVNSFNQFENSSRGYVQQKINTLYSIRAGYSREYILVDKTDRGTVSLGIPIAAGMSLGMLKPVYIEVFNNEGFLRVERYDPNIHDFNEIYGRAGFFTGFDEIEFRPGLYVKSGASFDFNLLDDKVTTLEIGAIADYFFASVPIMFEPAGVESTNKAWFIQLYLTVNFGKKWN
jgi:hypothetical protein